MLCIVYVIAVTTLLGMAGVLVERALPANFPRRWIWCVTIALSLLIPPVYRLNHAASVTDAFVQSAARNELYAMIISPLWLASSAILVLWGLTNAVRVALIMHRSRKAKTHRNTVDGYSVVVTDAVGPATVGILRSNVLLPRWVLALPRIQRQYVVRHEAEHRSAHDARLLFAASLTLLLVPWNLALWWMLRRLALAVEMDCDNRVVAALGNPNAYGELLLKVAQASSRGPSLQPALLGKGMLERRLIHLVAPEPLRRMQRFLLPALACALLVVVFIMPHPVLPSDSPDAHAAMTTPVSSVTR